MSIVPGGGGGGRFRLKIATPMRPPSIPKIEFTTIEMIMPTSCSPELAVSRSTISRISGVTFGLLERISFIHSCCIGPANICSGIDRIE